MSNRHIYIGISVAVILLIPFLFDIPWTIFDYFVAAILISTTIFVLEITTRNIINKRTKFLVGLIILASALYVWAELAVGILTNLGS